MSNDASITPDEREADVFSFGQDLTKGGKGGAEAARVATRSRKGEIRYLQGGSSWQAVFVSKIDEGTK